MTDQLKAHEDLQRAIRSYQSLADSPFVRLQREMQLSLRTHQELLRTTSSVSSAFANLTKSLSIQPRFAAEMAAMQQALQSSRRAFDEFSRMPKLNTLIRPFPFSDLVQQMQIRAQAISLAYRDFGSNVRSFALVPSTTSAAHIAGTADANRQMDRSA